MFSVFYYLKLLGRTLFKHTYGFQKDAEQNFDTYGDPIWSINYNLKTFLKSSKPFVLFVSDKSLFSIFKSVKSPAFGKENVRFPDSPEFENLPDFRTGRDVR